MQILILLIEIIAWIFALTYIQSQDFIENFWSNLASACVIAIFFGIFINQFTTIAKKPNLKMTIRQRGKCTNKIIFNLRDDGNYETSYRLAIQNSGNKVLKPQEGYWHYYLPGAIKTEIINNEDGKFLTMDEGHYRDYITLPIYPKSFLDINMEHRHIVPKERKDNFKAYYFFETDYGFFPSTVKMDPNSSEVEYEKMGEMEVEFVDK